MACNNCSIAVFLIGIVLFQLTYYPPANAQFGNFGPILQGVSLPGRLCCTSTGNCPGEGLANTTVKLNCTILGTLVTVGQATTGPTGIFNIALSRMLAMTLGYLNGGYTPPCSLVVQLPLNSTACPVLSAVNGTLTSAVQLVGMVTAANGGLLSLLTPVGFASNNGVGFSPHN